MASKKKPVVPKARPPPVEEEEESDSDDFGMAAAFQKSAAQPVQRRRLNAGNGSMNRARARGIILETSLETFNKKAGGTIPKRKVLLAAWASRGLAPAAIFEDAEGPAAAAAPYVDVWALTASCKDFSARNHNRVEERGWATLAGVNASLEYVRRRRPRVILAENVCAEAVVKPLTAMLARLPGYQWETGRLDPREVAGARMARARQYWVGLRVD